MVIYLRDTKTRINYYEVEFYETYDEILKNGRKEKIDYIELKSHIYSSNCFKLLLDNYYDKNFKNKFIEIFSFLEELRGWYYEIYLPNDKNVTYGELLKTLREMLSNYARDLNFCVVED